MATSRIVTGFVTIFLLFNCQRWDYIPLGIIYHFLHISIKYIPVGLALNELCLRCKRYPVIPHGVIPFSFSVSSRIRAASSSVSFSGFLKRIVF